MLKTNTKGYFMLDLKILSFTHPHAVPRARLHIGLRIHTYVWFDIFVGILHKIF